MTQLTDLSAKARRERVRLALNGVLRQITVATPTSEIVKRVSDFLGLATNAERTLIARDIMALSKGHPCARQTAEEFVKYSRTMKRWEWLPSHSNRTSPISEEELERRRAAIAADAAEDDQWTVHPVPPAPEGGYLDEEV